jgi:tRNA nucleotidyltransferase/poly(A) polymerase
MAGLIGGAGIGPEPRPGAPLPYNAPVEISPPASAPDVPEAVRGVIHSLTGAGHAAALVGGCLRDLCLGRPVTDWDVTTSAPPTAVLALFPRAIPIGLRHGTVMVPSAAGPIDVTTWRAGDLAGDLARRDFTVNAMALSLTPPGWIDPEGGLADLRAGRLRAVRSARERLREDPARALRALRLVSELGLELDGELAAALREAAPAVRAVAAERVRGELERLLLGRFAERALGLLRDLGLERELVGAPIAADAPQVVAALPPDLTLRLAAWLRGRDAAALLGRLRFPRHRAAEVGRLVRLHPIDAGRGPGEIGRLLLRLERSGVEALLALREAELDASPARETTEPARARLAELRRGLELRVRAGVLQDGRPRLAVGGAEVMAWLGCRPGPEVGRALHYLTLRVLEDPARNDPETLRELLRAWRAS